ncbi:MAG: helix-turn-helix transcriptional regulator [Clostridia bacterium]|nr:helix-turn-helix transcriptional regulator [Clostridia bacterium]
MEHQSYYRRSFTNSEYANCRDDRVPLVVNCTGYVAMTRSFWTTGCRHDYYLQLMDAGELVCGAAGGEYCLMPGEFIVYPPECPYRYGLTEDRELGYYWAHFTGNYAERLLVNNGIVPGRVYRLNDEIPASLRRAFGEMFHEFMMHGRGYEDLCAAKLTAVLVELGRSAVGDGIGREKRFADLLEYIHRHYTEDLCIAELAESEHLSVSRFREVFRRTFGCAPSEYIIGLRLQHARDLLAGTDLTIAEIAEMCGYNDELYFMRLFRKKTGMSARTYRLGHTVNRTGMADKGGSIE